MKALGQTGAAKRRKSLMRYMMIVKMTPAQEATLVPTDEDFATMGKYNDELIDAGVLLAAEGLQPSAMGFKVRKAGGKPHIVDGPFTETKELVAGFWIIQVKSHDEAVEWARRVPLNDGEEIEVRKIVEMSDFQDVAGEGREALEREQAWRDANPQAPLSR